MNTNSRNRGLLFLALGVLGLVVLFAAGYGVALLWSPALYLKPATLKSEAPVRVTPAVAATNPTPVKPSPAAVPPVGNNPPRPQSAEIEERVQAFIDQLPPEQQVLAEALRQQVKQNGDEWRKLPPEERKQRMASFATTALRLSPQDLQRLQSQFNPTPEQREEWRRRMKEFQNRPRNGSGQNP